MPETNVERFKLALNIDREPFCDEGISGLFFPGGNRQELRDQLLHLTRYGPPLLFLMGENGVGKSKLVEQLQLSFDPSIYRWVFFTADVLSDENVILQNLAAGFDIDLGDSEESAIQALFRAAREMDSYSQTPLLIIDDAQNLSPSGIAFIQSLMNALAATGMRIMLVIDGVSETKVPVLTPLRESGLDYQAIMVPPLSREEVKEYIEYRMVTSGLGEIQFNSDQLAQIYNHSQGNIDKINIVARQLLVNSFPYKKNQKKPFKLPVLHITLTVVLSVLLGLSYWVDDETEPATTALNLESAEASKLNGAKPQVSEPLTSRTEENKQLKAPLETSKIEEELDTFIEEKAAIDFNYEDKTSDQEIELQPVADKKSEPKGNEKAPPATVKVAQPAQTKVTPVVAKEPANNRQVTPKPESSSRYTDKERWLLTQDKTKYTLQLLGAREQKTVNKFFAQYPNLKDMVLYRTVRHGKDWYVVVYGLYSSKSVARQEAAKLPKSLRKSEPWARSIASVQEDIRKRAK